MNYEYFCPKKDYKNKKICYAQIFFRNGDYVNLSEREVISVAVKFYDSLIAKEQGFCAVGKRGKIILNINAKRPYIDDTLVYNLQNYYNDRKKYIEERCVNQGEISHVCLFDDNHVVDTIYGDIVANKKEEKLVLSFKSNSTYGAYKDENHKIMIKNVTKNSVNSILFNFTTNESFEIFKNEIIDLKIDCNSQLKTSYMGCNRQVVNGYIRIKLNKDNDNRLEDIETKSGERATIKELEYRLCRDCQGEVDVYSLVVTYNNKYTDSYKELLTIKKGYAWAEKFNFDKEKVYHCDTGIGGYAKRESDGTILLVLGEPKF